jgi:hypothetical protein
MPNCYAVLQPAQAGQHCGNASSAEQHYILHAGAGVDVEGAENHVRCFSVDDALAGNLSAVQHLLTGEVTALQLTVWQAK